MNARQRSSKLVKTDALRRPFAPRPPLESRRLHVSQASESNHPDTGELMSESDAAASGDAAKPKRFLDRVAIGATVAGGTVASAVGVAAAGSSATATISAFGAAAGGVVGAVFGSSVGLATGGVGMAATVPFAAGGAAIGGWLGPALAVVGVGTAPAWALPVAIGGGVIATSGAAIGIYKLIKRRRVPPDA